MPTAGSPRAVRIKNLVGFRLDDVTYALDIFRVREIIKPLPVFRLPRMPPAVIGVADHRGDVVPVIDLRLRFGLAGEPSRRNERWIVVRRADRFVGLVVEEVTEVFAADDSQKREAPEIGAGEESKAIASVYACRGTLVFVIDADTITDVADEIDVAAAHEWLKSRGDQ